MCAPCEAAQARREAAGTLRQAVEQRCLSDALRKAFPVHSIPPEMWALLDKF